jgi:hypothetical protein
MTEEQRRAQIKLQQQRAAQRAALAAHAASTPTSAGASGSATNPLDPIPATIMCGLDPTTNMGACGNYSNAQALMAKANVTTEAVRR